MDCSTGWKSPNASLDRNAEKNPLRLDFLSTEFREAINRNFERTPEWGAPEIL